MLYRIAIYRTENGKRVFDHYASGEEMKLLRVNTKGKVEKLYTQREYLDIKDVPTLMWYNIMGDWHDVSDTHEVEWGFEKDGKEYYVGDMIESKNEETIFYDTEQQCFAIGVRWLELRGENGETEVMCDVMNIPDNCGNVIGNIHEEEK